MGTDYRKSSHTTFRIELHIVWVTKYRYKILTKAIGTRTRDLLRRICTENRAEILSGSVSPDHVHLLVSIDPSVSVSDLLRQLKGKSSRLLQTEFPELGKKYWGQRMWARGYFAISSGNVTTEMIKEYIKHHFENKEDASDPFRVEVS
ncbi:MAG: IS200/IS605 family transposase [Candidatus Parcubacteria bacterium]|nr:IS200/IS605 family transposase [Candidatus Parcubacteria bacterium]